MKKPLDHKRSAERLAKGDFSGNFEKEYKSACEFVEFLDRKRKVSSEKYFKRIK